MTKLEKYIIEKYEGNPLWFQDEVKDSWQMNRVLKVLDNKEYLSGKHKIKKRKDKIYNGELFETRKIALNYAKTLLSFETAFLLKNPVTLISNDPKALKEYKTVYREGKYNKLDYKILDAMTKYGECYEYVYIDKNRRVKSILFNAEDSYPIYNHEGEMLGFIHHYIFDGISYYTIYSDETVTEYNDKGGDIQKVGDYINLSGLPIAYILSSEEDSLKGASSLDEYIDILDSMEDLLSKYTDSFYKFLDPIPVFKGTRLNTKEGGLDKHATGFALELAEDADFDYALPEMDSTSFKELWKTLKQSLLDISQTPAISMNSQEVSNLSETSIKMLYSLAEIKGASNERYISEGMGERFGKVKGLLKAIGRGVDEDAYIDCNYNYNIPQNEGDIIDNITKATEGGVMSIERAVEVNPYTLDVVQEVERLRAREGQQDKEREEGNNKIDNNKIDKKSNEGNKQAI